MLYIKLFLNLGVHLGHVRTNQETSKMNNYLLGKRNQISIIDLKKTIFFLKRALFFIKDLGKQSSILLFYVSNLYRFNDQIKLIFINLIYEKNNHSFFDQSWSFGALSNFNVQALMILDQLFYLQKIIKINEIYNLDLFKFYNLKWVDLLCRLIFYTEVKNIYGLSWNEHIKRIQKFWRFFIFFKFFRNFFILPDAWIVSDPYSYQSISSESESYKIPLIGLVDSNYYPTSITYAIPSNNDSILITLFFFKLFLNSYNIGKFNIINNF